LFTLVLFLFRQHCSSFLFIVRCSGILDCDQERPDGSCSPSAHASRLLTPLLPPHPQLAGACKEAYSEWVLDKRLQEISDDSSTKAIRDTAGVILGYDNAIL
jgi:hypothetical protein